MSCKTHQPQVHHFFILYLSLKKNLVITMRSEIEKREYSAAAGQIQIKQLITFSKIFVYVSTEKIVIAQIYFSLSLCKN